MLKFIGGVVVFVIVIAVIASVGSEDDASSSGSQEGGSSAGDTSKPGALTVENWEVQGKIRPKADALGDFEARFRVENTADHDSTPFFTLNAMKGNRIMASADCNGPEAAPGEIATVECFSTDEFERGWDRLTLEGVF